jgi:hypothetical protein
MPRHRCPPVPRSSAPTGVFFFSQQKEDRIATTIGIEFSGCNEGVCHSGRDRTGMDQVMLHRGKPAAVRRRECQTARGRRRPGIRRSGKVMLKPRDGRWEVEIVQVHGQIDRTSPAEAPIPVHELQAGDGDRALASAPLGLVIAVALGAGFPQHGCQRQTAELAEPIPKPHDSALSLGRRLTQFFMLMT